MMKRIYKQVIIFSTDLFFIFCFNFVLVSASTAQADCGLTLNANDININWDLNFSSLAISVQVNRSTTDACDFALGFGKGNGASYNTRQTSDAAKSLRYQLYKDSGLSK